MVQQSGNWHWMTGAPPSQSASRWSNLWSVRRAQIEAGIDPVTPVPCTRNSSKFFNRPAGGMGPVILGLSLTWKSLSFSALPKAEGIAPASLVSDMYTFWMAGILNKLDGICPSTSVLDISKVSSWFRLPKMFGRLPPQKFSPMCNSTKCRKNQESF